MHSAAVEVEVHALEERIHKAKRQGEGSEAVGQEEHHREKNIPPELEEGKERRHRGSPEEEGVRQEERNHIVVVAVGGVGDGFLGESMSVAGGAGGAAVAAASTVPGTL